MVRGYGGGGAWWWGCMVVGVVRVHGGNNDT